MKKSLEINGLARRVLATASTFLMAAAVLGVTVTPADATTTHTVTFFCDSSSANYKKLQIDGDPSKIYDENASPYPNIHIGISESITLTFNGNDCTASNFTSPNYLSVLPSYPAFSTPFTNGATYVITANSYPGVNSTNFGVNVQFQNPLFKIQVDAPPAITPSAPTSLSATPGDGQATISFIAGADGGAAITNYEYSTDGSTWNALSPAGTTSPVTITGLTNGTAYSIAVRAVNSVGSGAVSNAVSVTPATTPSAPTALSATSGDGDATISFTAGANGGAAITNYEYSTDGSTWIALSPADTTSPVTIPGLTNGTAYSIYLRSENSVGSGTASGAVSVTPAASNSGGGGSGSGSTIAPVIPGSNPAIPSSGVQLGQWVYLLDGVKKSLNVEPDAHVNATGLDISGAGFTMALQGQSSDGKPLGVTSDGALILQQDRIAAVEGTGFKPNTEVEIYVFSTPRYLGSVHTDVRGNFKGTVPIPQNLAPGRHTLQSNGFSSTGAIRSLSIGVLLSSQKNSVKTKTIHFSSMSWKLTSRSKAKLRALAKTYKSNAVKITVQGNVQNFGPHRNNKSLSTKRANAVVKYLRSQGVNATYVTNVSSKAKNKRSSARNAVVQIEYVKE